MISPTGRVGKLAWKAFAWTLAFWALSGATVPVYGGGRATPGNGYGPVGFGLNYHPGYGYGGNRVGVGPNGGYPFYGGPGYPHEAPALRRCGHESPFSYYGGPGDPSCGSSNTFGPVGPLVVDPPVVAVGDRGDLGNSSDFGAFTGAIPYPATLFAPYGGPSEPRRSSSGAR